MTAQDAIYGPLWAVVHVGARLVAGGLLWTAGRLAGALHDWDDPDTPGDVG